MPVVERFICANNLHKSSVYHSWGSTPAASKTAVVPRITSCSETTTTLPSRVPPATSDCFDSDYTQHPKTLMVQSAVFLGFTEFNGYAPRVPILVQMEFSDGLYELEHSELGVYGRGETSGEAFVDFLEYLVSDYKAYAEESEDNLDSHARALAERYRKMLKRV